MHCEICGAEILGAPHKIGTGGSELTVCNGCVKYGTVVGETHTSPKDVLTGRTGFRPGGPRYKKIEIEEINPNYGQMIRKAREKIGLTQEKLAKKVNEKMSLIGKIERSEIVPEDTVRKKLERLLDITLIERLEAQEVKPSKGSKTLTLGDIALIKKGRR